MTRPDSPVPAARREPSRPPLVAIVTVSGVIAVAVAAAIVSVPVGIGTVYGVVVIGAVAVAVAVVIARLEGKEFPFLRGLFSVAVRRAVRHGSGQAESGLVAGAGWRAMRLAAWLMPRAAGRRWLAEAESFAAEAPPALRRGAIRSYLTGAPQVIMVSWPGGPGSPGRDPGDAGCRRSPAWLTPASLPRHLPARPQPGECSALARAFSAAKGWPRTCTRLSAKP